MKHIGEDEKYTNHFPRTNKSTGRGTEATGFVCVCVCFIEQGLKFMTS